MQITSVALYISGIISFFVGGYRIVYKKVPEFIVPDLTGFEVIQLY